MNASEQKDLVRDLRRAASAVHLCSEASVAKDLADRLTRAADEITRLRERCEAYKGQVEFGSSVIDRLRSAQKNRAERLKAAGCTSADGTFVHASTESVLNALGVNQPEQKDSVSVPRAIEHAEYLAKGVEAFLSFLNGQREMHNIPNQDGLTDRWRGLQKLIHEFRKRAALASPAAVGEEAATYERDEDLPTVADVKGIMEAPRPIPEDVVERAKAIADGLGVHAGQYELIEALALTGLLTGSAAEMRERCPSVDETIEFIIKAHAGQTDKCGEEYWRHPVAVMNLIENATEHEKLVALLHDVIEDTETKPIDLLKMGYPFEVVWDVNTITKHGNAPYQIWIETIASLGSAAAIRVKMADLQHNLQRDRLDNIPIKDSARLTLKYRTAWLTLKDALAKAIRSLDPQEKK